MGRGAASGSRGAGDDPVREVNPSQVGKQVTFSSTCVKCGKKWYHDYEVFWCPRCDSKAFTTHPEFYRGYIPHNETTSGGGEEIHHIPEHPCAALPDQLWSEGPTVLTSNWSFDTRFGFAYFRGRLSRSKLRHADPWADPVSLLTHDYD